MSNLTKEVRPVEDKRHYLELAGLILHQSGVGLDRVQILPDLRQIGHDARQVVDGDGLRDVLQLVRHQFPALCIGSGRVTHRHGTAN